jgi:cell division protease FtsH
VNFYVKNILFWLVIVVSAFLLWEVVKQGGNSPKEKPVNFSQFMTDVDQGNVKDVTITGMEVRGHYRNDGSGFKVIVPANYPDMIGIKILRDKGVAIDIREVTYGCSGSWLLNIALLILLGAICFFMIRQTKQAGQKRQAQGQ